MKTSKVIFDIQAREGVVARGSMHREKPEDITMSVRAYPIEMPAQCAVMNMVSYCLTMLREKAEQDPSVKGRYTFIVPENVAIRFFEAQLCVNRGIDIFSRLRKQWMLTPQYNIEFVDEQGTVQTANVWELAIMGLANELQVMLDKSSGWSLNFVNSRTLYRYEIIREDGGDVSEILTAGQTVNFNDGVDTEGKGLKCREFNFLSGQFTVTRRDVRDRNQHVTAHFYVPRLIQAVNEEDGSQISTTSNVIVANDNLEPMYQNGVYVVNAAYLRTKTAEMLPRIKSTRNATVTTVEAESKQF